MSTPLHYSGQRGDDSQPPRQRASDGDMMVVYAALQPYAVPIETVVRRDPPLPFGMLRRVARPERVQARRDIRARHA